LTFLLRGQSESTSVPTIIFFALPQVGVGLPTILRETFAEGEKMGKEKEQTAGGYQSMLLPTYAIRNHLVGRLNLASRFRCMCGVVGFGAK
jgi:hypothetical protein